MTPASRMTSRSAITAASSGSWVTMTQLPVNSRRWRRSSWRTAPAGGDVERGERLVQQQQPRLGRQRAGQRHPLGLPTRQRARLVAACAARPIRSSQVVATSSAVARGTPRLRGPKATFARAVRCGNSRWSWNTNAPGRRSGGTRIRRSGSSSTWPSTSMQPRVSGCNPASARNNVVLPAPLGPSMATTSPSSTRRWTSRHSVPRSTSIRASTLMRRPGRRCRASDLAATRARPPRWPAGRGSARWRRPRGPRAAGTRPAAGSRCAPGCCRRR